MALHPNILAALNRSRVKTSALPRCEAVARSTGEPCRQPRILGTDPPRCRFHGGYLHRGARERYRAKKVSPERLEKRAAVRAWSASLEARQWVQQQLGADCIARYGVRQCGPLAAAWLEREQDPGRLVRALADLRQLDTKDWGDRR